jgi:hypothetical protein
MGDEDRRISSTLPGVTPIAQVAKVTVVPAKKPEPEPMTWDKKLRHLMEATETRVRMLKQHHADQMAAMQAEIDRLTHASSEERQAHQLTKHKLVAANNEIDRLTHIAVNAAADAHEIISTGEETLRKSAVEMWELVTAMYRDLGIEMQAPVTDKFQRKAAALGFQFTDQETRELLDGLFAPESERPEDAGDRATQVGHKPPHQE